MTHRNADAVAETVLVVDEEQSVRELLLAWLADAGYETCSGASGAEGMKALSDHRPDLVVADVVMPEMDGNEFCRLVRGVSSAAIMVLSVRGDEDQKIKCLDLGADDYVVKPVSMSEFLARVAALLRRRRWSGESPAKEDSYQDSELTILHERHEVMVRGERVDLTPTEFKLLRLLTESVGKTCGVDEIRKRIWGSPHYSPELVRWHIARLRGKIEADTSSPPRRIVTVHGVGYRYEAPVASPAESGGA